MNLVTNILIPVVVGLFVNLITGLFTSNISEKRINIALSNNEHVETNEYNYHHNEVTNIYQNKESNTQSSNFGIEFFVLVFLAMVLALYFILNNYLEIAVGLILFNISLIVSTNFTKKRIKRIPLPNEHQKSMISQIKLMQSDLYVMIIFTLLISLRYIKGDFEVFAKITEIPELLKFIFINIDTSLPAISLVATLGFVLFKQLQSTLHLISISMKPFIYRLDPDSFSFSIFAPIAHIVKDKYYSKTAIRKETIISLIVMSVLFYGLELFYIFFLNKFK